MNRFFADKIVDSKAFLSEEDAYHIRNVLRAKPGDRFEICNGVDREYIAVLSYADKKTAELDIIEELDICREPAHNYVLCQCVPKCRKSDDVVRHATELGMSKFYPVISERVNIKNADDYDKTERLQKIAAEAAKQSKRTIIPTVNKPVSFGDMIRLAPQNALRIIAWEEEHKTTLAEALREAPICKDIYILVGPEGGLSSSEVDVAASCGWKSITLGNRILRTETAPLALLAAIAYHFGDMA